MNFNFGEVLTRAGQITWKYKILWLSGIFMTLIGLLSLPISMIFNDPFSSFMMSAPAEINQRMGPMLLANGLIFLLSIVSIPVYIVGMSIPSLATRRLEKGEDQLSFGELFRESLPYFWRVLGIYLLVCIGMFAFVVAFLACIGILSVVTFGFGSLCAFPLFFLFIPFAILVYSLMEQGMSAILVDNLGVFDALQRAWALVRKNLGVMALLSILIYFGAMVVGMVISIPMMIPMFGFFSNMSTEPDFQSFNKIYRNMTLWMLALSPLYAVFQGILLTFMQSVWTLTYMRLTGKPESDNHVTPSERSDPVQSEDNNKTLITREPTDDNKTIMAKKPDA
jgi:hypothetical protein